jgi:hypothetical protein
MAGSANLHDVPSLFRRQSQTTDPDAGPTTDEPVAESDTGSGASGAARAGVRPRAYTPGKGRATPKRREARKRVAEPPPKDRKEATRRMRERLRAERAEARAGMMAGDEKYLPPRDQGPERALVRDIVDARRNIGTWFFGGAVVILIGTWPTVPDPIRVGFEAMWLVLLVAVVIDSFLLCRLVKRLLRERYPKTAQRPAGLYTYAIMRAITLRRMRLPRPRVSVGDAI